MIYEVIAKTEPEETSYEHLSYEDVLEIIIDSLLSEERIPLTIRRRCCSSIAEHTMSAETQNKMRELAGAAGHQKDADLEQVIMKLDTAINNWYLKGEISLSEKGVIKPFGVCGADGRSV